MKILKHTWVSPARPCRFSLCLQAGGAFADFDVDSRGRVFLVRISFDGYGCYVVEDAVARMPLDVSRTLLDSVDADDVDRDEIRMILYRYFEENESVIGLEPLMEHELIRGDR